MRILSLDGGGIRGLLTAALIARLSVDSPGWLNHVDMLAGTSTGGILALAIARGLKEVELIDLYRLRGAEIFHESLLDRLTHMDELVVPDFDAENLRTVLVDVFGDGKLGDLKQRVLVTTFDLERGRFKVLDSTCSRDQHVSLVDAGLCTSAAPTYFRTHLGRVDGGVVANNPAMVAVAQAWEDGHRDKIALLSIGTGCAPARLYPFKYTPEGQPQALSWGIARWAPRLIPLLFDSGLDAINFYCSRILGDDFHRLNPPLREPVDLADVAAVPMLLNASEIADTDVDAASSWLRRRWPTAASVDS